MLCKELISTTPAKNPIFYRKFILICMPHEKCGRLYDSVSLCDWEKSENFKYIIVPTSHRLTLFNQDICLFSLFSLLARRYTTPMNRSRFESIHIWFVTNMRQEQTICTTLDLIWRKQQVGQKLAFYFWPKLAVCSKPSQMCVILKRCSSLVKHAPMPHSK